MTTITELKKLLFSMILKTPIWLVHLAANQSSVMSIPILFNSFFDCHYDYIPDILKRAAIVPVYKSGEKSNPINYRPISLTPILMKILERIVRKQVVQFLTDNNFLNSTQHGFREGRSCLSALLNVYDDIVHMISDPSAVVDMIYLDFAKAFDKVDLDNHCYPYI